MIHSTAQNQIKSPLLRLPAEICNQIYEYVLSDASIYACSNYICRVATDSTSSRWGVSSHAHFPRHLLHLLEVCQQIHSEARLLLFNINCLAGEIGDVHDFLTNEWLGFDQVSALKSLQLEIWGDYNMGYDHEGVTGNPTETIERKFETFAKLAGLEDIKISICCWGPSHQNIGKSAKSNIEAIFYRKGKTVKVEVLVHRF